MYQKEHTQKYGNGEGDNVENNKKAVVENDERTFVIQT